MTTMDDSKDESNARALTLDKAESIAALFSSVTHPTRIIILNLLKDQYLEFSDLIKETRIRKTALSNHLNLLISKRLIERVSHGQYKITPNGESLLDSVLGTYESSVVRHEEERRKLYERFAQARSERLDAKKLQIELVVQEPMTVASVSARGKSPQDDAWKKLVSFAEPRGLFKDSTKHPVFSYNLLMAEDNPPYEEYDHVFLIGFDPDTELDEGVEIGIGTKIWHFSHILSGSTIGERCNIGQNVVIGPDVTIGNGCKIQNNVSVYKGVTLEDNVFCGPSLVFTNVFNPRAHIRRMDKLRPTLIKKGATLGANCTIICGHSIGSYAFIGAGAVVTKSVPDYALMVGVPAQIVGWVCKCGEKLNFAEDRAACKACSKRYRLIDSEKLEQETL